MTSSPPSLPAAADLRVAYDLQADTLIVLIEQPPDTINIDLAGELWALYDAEAHAIVGFEIEDFTDFSSRHPALAEYRRPAFLAELLAFAGPLLPPTITPGEPLPLRPLLDDAPERD